MLDNAPIHPDIFPPLRAAQFLGLTDVCPTPQAAITALHRLAKRHHVPRLRWGKEYTYHRTALESIISAELAQVQGNEGKGHSDD